LLLSIFQQVISIEVNAFLLEPLYSLSLVLLLILLDGLLE
jgi:hypothetical protein